MAKPQATPGAAGFSLPQPNCYLEGVRATALRLVATSEALLALDAMQLSNASEQLAKLFVRLRVQCDTIITHATKYAGDTAQQGSHTAYTGKLINALALDKFTVAYPDLLGSK